MADKKEEVVIEVVGETAVKKTSTKTTKASTATKTTAAKATTAKKPAAKKESAASVEAAPVAEAPAAEAVATEPVAAKAPAKKASKKQAVKAPLYINGRYVVEKQLPAKPQKGAKPYAEAKGSVKVTLVKSTAGCLKDQQATVKALGLTKIRSSKVLPDNDATRGMIFKVKHLVVVEEVK